MFNPGDLVRCRFLSGLYTPLGVIIREVVTKDPLVYEVLVMHRSNLPGGTSSPKRSSALGDEYDELRVRWLDGKGREVWLWRKELELVNESR